MHYKCSACTYTDKIMCYIAVYHGLSSYRNSHFNFILCWLVAFFDESLNNSCESSASADCNKVDPSLNIVVDSSQLPAQHGTDVTYSCPQNSVILDRNVKAVCTDYGRLSLSPENVSPCKGTSK